MIPMKWREDSENSENSALDTIIVSHKIYEKKYFLIGFTWYTSLSIPVGCLIVQSEGVKSNRLKNIFCHIFCVRQ